MIENAYRFTRREAAAFLTSKGYKVAPTTLAKLACVGGGPLFESFGRRPLYTEANLLDWVRGRKSHIKRSTSDKSQCHETGILLHNINKI